jgi:two-component sensor histidine kinase
LHRKLFTILTCCIAYTLQAQVTRGLVAKYSFNDGTANDNVGKLHAKTVSVSLVDDRFGNPRSAYYLHGTYGSYLNLGTSSVLKPVKGTISLWFKIDTPIEAGEGYKINPIILTKCQPGDDFFEAYCIYYHYETGKLSAASTLSSLNQVGLHSSSKISTGEWHHVAMSYDDNTLSFYIDGSLEKSIAKNFTTHFLAGDSVMIGNSANTKNKRFFNGSIDDIEIYNRVLSAAEIKSLYEAPNPNRYSTLRKWILLALGMIVGLGLIILYIIHRYKKALDKERVRHDLQHQLYNMEIRVMKAQMNPHFIFNSLNVIQQFILANDNERAYKYLSKFSKLVRRLLESNTANHILLSDEIELLERYLEIEALRFEQTFEYHITVDPAIHPDSIQIPHMLIQPFVENALWHGLLHKKSQRKLQLCFLPAGNDRILCVVDDNGVGRPEKKEGTNDKKSMAIDMITQRLRLIEKIYGIRGEISIIDKKNERGETEGTRVEIFIPILEL